MQTLLILLLAAPTLAAAVYVHYRLPVHVERSARALWFLRALLVGVGLALGYVGTFWMVEAGFGARAAVFLLGLGVAHVPAFFVLFIKRRRGEYGHG